MGARLCSGRVRCSTLARLDYCWRPVCATSQSWIRWLVVCYCAYCLCKFGYGVEDLAGDAVEKVIGRAILEELAENSKYVWFQMCLCLTCCAVGGSVSNDGASWTCLILMTTAMEG